MTITEVILISLGAVFISVASAVTGVAVIELVRFALGYKDTLFHETWETIFK